MTKYLGVIIDHKLTWKKHQEYIKDKITTLGQQLKRVGGKTWGVNREILKIWYKTIAEKQITYGAEIWQEDLNTHGQRRLISLQRKAIIQVTKPYNSISSAALNVITGIAPITQIVKHYKNCYSVRKGEPLTINNINYTKNQIESRIKPINYNLTEQKDNLNILMPNEQTPETEITAYTDGLRNNRGTGLAYCIYKNETIIKEYKEKLKIENSIYQAEQLAIFKTIKWYENTQYKTILINTDNLKQPDKKF